MPRWGPYASWSFPVNRDLLGDEINQLPRLMRRQANRVRVRLTIVGDAVLLELQRAVLDARADAEAGGDFEVTVQLYGWHFLFFDTR